MTMVEFDKHVAIAHLPLPSGADVVKFDPGLRRIMQRCFSGVIAVYQEDDEEHFRKLEEFPVKRMVHSRAVDTSSHRVYAPEQEEHSPPVARLIVYEPVLLKEEK